ncbi:N-acetylmannosamine-6-phosphate 2-epimerase [Cutibacterium acnes JCM 18909]|nr:N-acetylmannosamine-6-phosphate 2-epimerase [Cutibacterium acnes JCM 18909]
MSGFTDRIIASMAGGLVVSCQAYPGEPLRHPETMAQMAAAVEAGGAVAVRAQGLSDVSAVKGRVSVPVVGIWKEGDEASTSPRPCAMHAAWQLPGLTSSPSMAPDANVPTG